MGDATFAQRAAWVRQGLLLEYATVGYNVLEGVIAVASGLAAGSVALIGFGFDSAIEVAAGSILLWRLRAEFGGRAVAERVERRAEQLIGITFFLLAGYILQSSLEQFINHHQAQESPVGIGLAVFSLASMPLVALWKRRLAGWLGSRALAAEAMEQFVCSYLSLALLLGLGANALFGWWWADPIAALAMLPIVVREGWEAIRGEEEEA